ncbi:putative envelope glycoprotein [Trichinella pseudospiralis]
MNGRWMSQPASHPASQPANQPIGYMKTKSSSTRLQQRPMSTSNLLTLPTIWLCCSVDFNCKNEKNNFFTSEQFPVKKIDDQAMLKYRVKADARQAKSMTTSTSWLNSTVQGTSGYIGSLLT